MDDRIAGVVLTFVDLTERNRVTEALRKSEERLRILIESVRDYAIFTTDLERRIDTWNAAAESMFGYAENEIIGLSADILFVPDDHEKATRRENCSLLGIWGEPKVSTGTFERTARSFMVRGRSCRSGTKPGGCAAL